MISKISLFPFRSGRTPFRRMLAWLLLSSSMREGKVSIQCNTQDEFMFILFQRQHPGRLLVAGCW